MRTDFSRLPYPAVAGIAAFFLSGVNAAGADSSEDYARLMRLGEHDGVDYVRERDALLAGHPTQWDVDAAVPSWEAGLAAFILNGRLAEPKAFAQWDAQRPVLRANGRYYDLPGASVQEDLAFLLEKMWKGVTAKEREWAYKDLQLIRAKFTAELGNTALWRGIWENCPDDRFKVIVILYIASSDDPTVIDIIEEVLQAAEDRPLGAKHRCLVGLGFRPTSDSARAIISGWDQIERHDAHSEAATAALGANADERAREFLYSLALDGDEREWIRVCAVGACCATGHPRDREMFEKLMKGPGSDELKRKALRAMQNCPLEHVRPAVHEALSSSREPNVISQAMLTLDICYIMAKEIDDGKAAADVKLLQMIAEREDLHISLRAHIPGYVDRIEEKRRSARENHAGD